MDYDVLPQKIHIFITTAVAALNATTQRSEPSYILLLFEVTVI
jgi:hypothetical protein